MGTALLHARLSKAVRAKVGACLVTATGTIVPSWNGTPQGTNNDCEYVDDETGALITKPEVIHAELGAVLKCAKEGINTTGSTVYVTLAPCLPCSAMLKQAGVKKVVYKFDYRLNHGVQYLQKNGVEVIKI